MEDSESESAKTVGVHRGFLDLEPTEEVMNRPPGGHVYLFHWNDPARKEDWRADGYNWRQNGGGIFKLDGVKGKKIYFKLVTGKNRETKLPVTSSYFTKRVYLHPKHPQRVLIHYIGDESVAVPLVHGNSKRRKQLEKPFVRTLPSILHAIPKSGTPSHIYREMVEQSPSELTGPRNLKQISNAQNVARRKIRQTNDALYKVYEMANEARDTQDEFIRSIQVAPEHLVMAYNGDLAEQFRRLVLKNEPLCLAYCTMVKLTASFNASFLLFRQTEFVEAPVIPLVVVIHQQMTADTHSIFWQNVAQHFPELKSEGVTYLVTGDRSQDMVDAVARSFPHMEVFRCVNHVLDDTNNKLKSMADLRAEDVIIYEEEVKMLFSQTSRLQYMEKLTSCMISWHREFSSYFYSYIHPEIDRIGAWGYTKYGVAKCTTTNLPDLLNSAVEKIREWKEAPIDTVLVCLNQLFKSFNAELTRSHFAIGSYTLRPDVAVQYDKSKQEMPHFPPVESAEEIVRRVRDSYESNNNHLTVHQRAKELLQSGSVNLDCKRGKFSVSDHRKDYSVQLFPKPRCPCQHSLSSTPCCHILACQIAIGLSNSDDTDSSDFKNEASSSLYKRASSKKAPLTDIDHNYLSSLATLSAVASEHQNGFDYSSTKDIDVSSSLCVCVTEVDESEVIQEAELSPNVTIVEESSIPLAVATISSEENMDTSDTDGSKFKIFLICDAEQSLSTTAIGANEEVNMEP